ncbi:MAG: biotin/lipoyl-binding protein [Chloroflexi bacterium]|nr:biotin/lipoyl-binding protein [Chloroflexota bacterium]
MVKTTRYASPLKLISAIIGSLFALAACLSPVNTLPTPTPWPTPTVSAQTTFTVQRGTLIDQIVLNGEVVPVTWTPLAFRVEGLLGTIHKLEGDDVKPGDLLAELEMPDLQEKLAQAQVALEQAQDDQATHDKQRKFDLQRAQLEQSKAELLLDQAKKAGDATAVKLQEIQVQLAQLAVQEVEANIDPTLSRNVTKNQLAVEALQRQVEDRQLRAPYTGTVIALGVGLAGIQSLPERPQPHTGIPAYTPLMVVAQNEPLEVIVAGDVSRVNELKLSQPVTLTHYLARDKPFASTVSDLPALNASSTKQADFKDKLHISVPANHPPMKIGDSVQVAVLLAVHANTLILPDGAVRRFAGRTFVVVQDGDKQRRVDVTAGLVVNGQVEVLDGLREGDVIVGP